ncbi:uncharacterized protein IL334_004845 [Kwoniella shivajii]|uniref:Smr domain-containing protein n=1 Tax=Kwoniella shivajii TaxID=564305 RepID=A0ABZ1D1G7_9TREE|nr:hypothetical protein IL334_004845 [Kwoniella shivajii]
MVHEESIDSSSLAAILAADYPLIDPPLILALLSDYQPRSISSDDIENIKDQLGILEATLVPDSDIDIDIDTITDIISESNESLNENTSAGSTTSGFIDEISNRLESLHTTSSSNDPTASTSSSRSKKNGHGNGSKTSNKSDISGSNDDDYGDEGELLKSLFPSISEEDLNSALRSHTTLQEAIDYLLSLELIRNVEQEGHWPDEDVTVASEPELERWEESKIKSKKTKTKSTSSSRTPSQPPSKESSPLALSTPRFDNIALTPLNHSRLSTSDNSASPSLSMPTKKKKKDKIIIPLVDTLQRKASPAPSRPTSRSTSKSRTIQAGSRSSSPARISTSGPSNNAWHTVTSLSSYLSDLLPLPSNYFLSYLHSPEYHSAYSAILASLAKLPSSTKRDVNASRRILEDLYGLTLSISGESDGNGLGKREIERDLEICVHAAGEDVATVMDLMDLLGEISEWPSDDDFFDAKPDYTINHNHLNHILKPETISINLHPIQAIDMTRSSSATSTKSLDEPPKSTSNLPGKMTRPEKKVKAVLQQEEHLSGGAIREARIRNVPGSKPSITSISHPTALDSFGTTSPAPSSPQLGPKNLKQIHPQNWRTVSHARPNKPRRDGGERRLTVEQCMANAQLERARREIAIRAAGRNFKTNTNGIAGGGRAVKGAVAGHYATQAREAAERAREWELKAARLVVTSHLQAQNNPATNGTNHNHNHTHSHSRDQGQHGSGSGGTKTIDLHHLTIQEATTVVDEIAENWWKSEKETRSERWRKQDEGKLIVITGVGRHSANGKGVLGPAVASHLEYQDWRVDRGDSERGYLVIRGKK